MAKYRPGLPDMPENIRRLPVDPERGYPVPYFVRWLKGKPEFRLVDPVKLVRCIRGRACWICGCPLSKDAPASFVSGPLMAVTRASSEPPSHLECARFAAKACPFLAIPKMDRRPDNSPPSKDPPGLMVKRNPGVVLIWTSEWTLQRVEHGVLFIVSDPVSFEFWREGRPASRDEFMESLDEGMTLAKQAARERGATLEALADLVRKKTLALRLLGL